MIEIRGKFNTADVFAKAVEGETYRQILNMCNLKELKDAVIKIMPDCHAGAGCTIGTTIRMTQDTPINPYFVGVDIGCGVEVAKIDGSFSLAELDDIIRQHIPAGFSVHDQKSARGVELIDALECKKALKNHDRHCRSLGTLGGGNHFIELAENSQREKFLLVHSGSRNLGHEVATIYGKMTNSAGFLTGEQISAYLKDMERCQQFANLNRKLMVAVIAEKLKLSKVETVCTTIHNYIEIRPKWVVLRKGAIRAMKDELLVIPMNMRDGTILGKGKENPDWNYSAPHGAGRLLSRTEAKKKLKLNDFFIQMNGVFSTCISKALLDEAPMAYKPMDEIRELIDETVEILDMLKPVYNFKAPEK
jgi:RNA-splicing ligase RtcB